MHPDSRGQAKRRQILPVLSLITCLCALSRAEAGHESPYYPSFYPQEIRIETVEPAAAPGLLQANGIHAYLGTDPFAGGSPPPNISPMESLGSFLVVTFNSGSGRWQTSRSRCAARGQILKDVAGLKEQFVFHPYPVTPYHPDYLSHFDRVQAGRAPQPGGAGQRSGDPALRMRAQGALAEAVARSRWPMAHADWDARVEEVGLADLLAGRRTSIHGWIGPPWLKEGWFHAYLLLADTMADRGKRAAADRIYRQLATGEYQGVVQRLDLERMLVSLLTQGCERMVLGYTLKRSYVNSDFSAGIENIAQDSQAGFDAPIFFRTVKLKDFPWNGWLRIGTEAVARAAWNPVTGFSDRFGRLVWFAIGDPALLPSPSGGGWIPNRVVLAGGPADSSAARVEVPPDALLPEPGTGRLREVGTGKAASARLLYRVPLSVFHDGTRMSAADLLFAFSLAFRWGGSPGQSQAASDPLIEASTELVRERLAGLRIVKTEQEVRKFGPDLEFVWQVPIIEVFLHSTPVDPQHAAAIAPPWSSLPWHLLVLMEEAVQRGLAAFSPKEARRRGVAWLDLVRDRNLLERLARLAAEFEADGYLPDSLKGWVRADQARERWAALRQFHQQHGHLLVTNGPYRLESWSEKGAVLQVFRDTSYPLGVGAFDRYVLPPRAHISRLERRSGALRITAEIEKAVRVQRSYTFVREPLRRASATGPDPVHAVCSVVVIGPGGTVAQAGTGSVEADGSFTIDLKGLKSGRYTVMTAIYLNENSVNPEIRTLDYRAGP